MKTKFLALGFACAGLVSFAHGQTADAASAASPAPSRVIYTPQLPAVQELNNAAAAQHLTIQKIDQTAGQMMVTYQQADGQTTVVAYQTLGSASGSTATLATNGTAPSAVATPASAAPTVGYTAANAPTVVYTAPQVVYTSPVYYDYPYYAPYYGYPVGISVGFGYRGGWGYRGGYHGGGWHR